MNRRRSCHEPVVHRGRAWVRTGAVKPHPGRRSAAYCVAIDTTYARVPSWTAAAELARLVEIWRRRKPTIRVLAPAHGTEVTPDQLVGRP